VENNGIRGGGGRGRKIKLTLKYRRILLKLSGETLGGAAGSGYDPATLKRISNEIKQVYDLGVEIAIVVGGGNIFRGLYAKDLGFERCSADYMGMLATVMNALALQDAIEKTGITTRVLSALEVKSVTEPFILRRARRHLEKNHVLILAAGSGNPLFTTDTPAALRAVELRADVLLKATKVDGIYSKDPMKYNDAVKYDTIAFNEAIEKRLNVMDMTAFTLCMENDMPIVVFNIRDEGNILKIVRGENAGSLIHAKTSR